MYIKKRTYNGSLKMEDEFCEEGKLFIEAIEPDSFSIKTKMIKNSLYMNNTEVDLEEMQDNNHSNSNNCNVKYLEKYQDRNDNNTNLIDKLPTFILALILSKTSYSMMFKVMLVSKKWRKAADTKIFYESMLKDYCKEILTRFEIPESNYILIPDHFKDRSWKEIFQLKRIVGSVIKEEVVEGEEPARILGTKIIDKIGFYEGEIKANKQDGKGILYKIKLGKVYEGDFEKGKITGKGKRIWPNKDTYEGDFLESKRNGNGVLKLIGTGVYTGSFVNDKREGQGEMRFENGDVYIGSWKNDMANGKGVFSSKSGYIYEGEWVDNHKSGFGKLTYQRGTYEGEWKNNKAHGKGKIHFKNGTKYIGDMFENSWHGKGQFFWNDGRRYEGDFYFSKQQGQGTIYSADNHICYSGQFRNNRPHGYGTLYLKSGYRYEGQMKDGLKHGDGKILDSENHLCMEGLFSEGNFVGLNVKVDNCNSGTGSIINSNNNNSNSNINKISFNMSNVISDQDSSDFINNSDNNLQLSGSLGLNI